jgi:hypothetical protein
MSKTTITKVSKTMDMEGSGFHEVIVEDDTCGERIIIRQDGNEVHITNEAASVLADILNSMCRT